MLEKSGIADQLFEAIHIWTRRLPGGLALATVIMCIIFAASSGVIGATESVVGLLTIPIMLRYGYDKGAHLRHDLRRRLARHDHPAVGRRRRHGPARRRLGRRPPLRHGLPRPDHGRALPRLHLRPLHPRARASGRASRREPDEPPFAEKLWITTRNLVPPVFMIFAVLGSILLGWASPTEAAAIGALASVAAHAALRPLHAGAASTRRSSRRSRSRR